MAVRPILLKYHKQATNPGRKGICTCQFVGQTVSLSPPTNASDFITQINWNCNWKLATANL